MSWQIALPLMLVVVAGFPHGAADGVLGLRLAARGGVSLTLFMATYLAIAGAVVLLWWVAPLAGFVLFLALSVSHFGMMDTAATAHLPLRGPRVVIHGAAPITVVPLVHGDAVTPIFSLLVGGEVAALIDVLQLAAPIWALAVLWLALGQGAAGRRAAAEIAGLAVMLALLPPLWGVAVYFCAIHSVRHLRAVARALSPLGSRVWWQVAAFSAVSVAAVLAAVPWLATVDLDSGLIRATFIGLAALTVPHVLLIDVYGALKRVAPSLTPAKRGD